MTIEYDDFRRMTWEERSAIFSALSSEEKAELVRSQVSGWFDRHIAELTPEQIEILQEASRMVVPELYERPISEEVVAKVKDLEKRARSLLTPRQAAEALTMHWKEQT